MEEEEKNEYDGYIKDSAHEALEKISKKTGKRIYPKKEIKQFKSFQKQAEKLKIAEITLQQVFRKHL